MYPDVFLRRSVSSETKLTKSLNQFFNSCSQSMITECGFFYHFNLNLIWIRWMFVQYHIEHLILIMFLNAATRLLKLNSFVVNKKKNNFETNLSIDSLLILLVWCCWFSLSLSTWLICWFVCLFDLKFDCSAEKVCPTILINWFCWMVLVA